MRAAYRVALDTVDVALAMCAARPSHHNAVLCGLDIRCSFLWLGPPQHPLHADWRRTQFVSEPGTGCVGETLGLLQPTRLRRRVVKSIEAVVEVHRLALRAPQGCSSLL